MLSHTHTLTIDRQTIRRSCARGLFLVFRQDLLDPLLLPLVSTSGDFAVHPGSDPDIARNSGRAEFVYGDVTVVDDLGHLGPLSVNEVTVMSPCKSMIDTLTIAYGSFDVGTVPVHRIFHTALLKNSLTLVRSKAKQIY